LDSKKETVKVQEPVKAEVEEEKKEVIEEETDFDIPTFLRKKR